MGLSFKKLFKKSVKFNKDVFGGGYVRDAFGALGGGGGGGHGAVVDADYQRAQSALAQGQAQSIVGQKRAIGTIQGGYKNARTSLQAGKSSALTGAMDRGEQARAQDTQSLASRGLYNTTILENARQGNTAQTTRMMSDIDAAYAQMEAQYDVQEAGAVAGAQQGLAQSYAGFGQQQAGLHTGHAQMIASLPEEDANQWLNSLLGIAGTGIGYAIGGPPGGAAANQFMSTQSWGGF